MIQLQTIEQTFEILKHANPNSCVDNLFTFMYDDLKDLWQNSKIYHNGEDPERYSLWCKILFIYSSMVKFGNAPMNWNFIQDILNNILAGLRFLDDKSLADLMISMYNLNCGKEIYWQRCMKQAVNIMYSFDHESLTSSIWAAARQGIQDNDFLRAWLKQAKNEVDRFCLYSLVKSLWSLANLEVLSKKLPDFIGSLRIFRNVSGFKLIFALHAACTYYHYRMLPEWLELVEIYKKECEPVPNGFEIKLRDWLGEYGVEATPQVYIAGFYADLAVTKMPDAIDFEKEPKPFRRMFLKKLLWAHENLDLIPVIEADGVRYHPGRNQFREQVFEISGYHTLHITDREFFSTLRAN